MLKTVLQFLWLIVSIQLYRVLLWRTKQWEVHSKWIFSLSKQVITDPTMRQSVCGSFANTVLCFTKYFHFRYRSRSAYLSLMSLMYCCMFIMKAQIKESLSFKKSVCIFLMFWYRFCCFMKWLSRKIKWLLLFLFVEWRTLTNSIPWNLVNGIVTKADFVTIEGHK